LRWCQSSVNKRVNKGRQSNRIFLKSEGRGIDSPTAGVGEQRSIIPNAVDGPVPPSSVRPGGGEDLISAQDPQLDEDALEWWSRNAPDESTEENGTEAESK